MKFLGNAAKHHRVTFTASEEVRGDFCSCYDCVVQRRRVSGLPEVQSGPVVFLEAPDLADNKVREQYLTTHVGLYIEEEVVKPDESL